MSPISKLAAGLDGEEVEVLGEDHPGLYTDSSWWVKLVQRLHCLGWRPLGKSAISGMAFKLRSRKMGICMMAVSWEAGGWELMPCWSCAFENTLALCKCAVLSLVVEFTPSHGLFPCGLFLSWLSNLCSDSSAITLSLLRKPVLSIELESFYELFGEGLEEDQGTKKGGQLCIGNERYRRTQMNLFI